MRQFINQLKELNEIQTKSKMEKLCINQMHINQIKKGGIR